MKDYLDQMGRKRNETKQNKKTKEVDPVRLRSDGTKHK